MSIKSPCEYLHILTTDTDPRAMIYGDHYILLYNEACVPIWGAKHPQALGKSPSVAFAESWPVVRDGFDQAYRDGKSTKINKIEVLLRRRIDMIVSNTNIYKHEIS